MKFIRMSQIIILWIMLIAPGGASVVGSRQADEPHGPPLDHPQAENMEYIGNYGGTLRALAVQGDYAYLAEGGRLTVLDISAPDNPVMIGKTAPLPPGINNLAISDGYAYLATTGVCLSVVAVSDHSHPYETGVFAAPSDEASCYDVAVSGNYAYLISYEGLYILDISDPANPTQSSFLFVEYQLRNIRVVGSYAYIGDYGGIIHVLNISDPGDPLEVGTVTVNGEPMDMAVEGDMIFVAHTQGVSMLDISDQANPDLAGYFFSQYGLPSVAAANNSLYLVETLWDTELDIPLSRLIVLDVSIPSTPILLGIYDPTENLDGVRTAGDYAYLIGSPPRGFQVIDVSDPANINLLGEYPTTGFYNAVAVAEDYAYVASETGLLVLDVSYPAAPSQVGYLEMDSILNGVVVAGNYAYVDDYQHNLTIIDISDPENPFQVGIYETIHISEVEVSGDYVFLTDGDRLRVIDVSDPSNPVEVSLVDTPSEAHDVVISGDYAYVADWWGGLRVIDISDPTHPFEAGGYYPDDYATMVAVDGNYAYLKRWWVGMWVLDISDPTTPVLVNTIGEGMPADIVVGGNYLYTGWEVFDLADPVHPVEAGSYERLNGALDAEVEGSFVLVADYYGGLVILNYTGVKDASSVTLSDYPDPSLAGGSFTAQVEVGAGFGVPSGQVSITVEGEPVGCTRMLASGAATCRLTLMETGTYTLTASYGGDGYFLPNEAAPITHTVVEPALFYLPLVGRE